MTLILSQSTHDAFSRPPRRLRNTLILISASLGALVLALLVCEWLEWPFLRHPLETKLSSLLARPVRIGPEFGMRLLGRVRAHTDELIIGHAAGGPVWVDESGAARDFLHAKAMRLSVSYGALYDQWRAQGTPPRIQLLEADHLELNLKRDAEGRANWQFSPPKPSPTPSAPPWPRFERLNVHDGDIRLLDEPSQLSAHAHLRTREGSAQRVDTSASGPTNASSRPAEEESATGLEIDGTGLYRKQPLTLQFRSSGLMPLASSDKAAPSVPIWLDLKAGATHIRLDGQGRDLWHLGGLDAAYRASGSSLATVGDALGITLPTTAAFTTHGHLRKDGAIWNVKVTSLHIGSSQLRGDFRFDTTHTKPFLSGTLAGTQLALPDLAPVLGAATPQALPASPSERVLPQREFDIPSLQMMNADIQLALDKADLGTPHLAPFAPLRGQIALTNGILSLHHLRANSASGQIGGTIVLDARTRPPQWNADIRWSGIQLEQFVKPRDEAVRKSEKDEGQQSAIGYIAGALAGDAQLKGRGASTAAVLASLDGQTRMWVRNGSLSHILVEAAGLDIAQGLGMLIVGDKRLPLRCALTQWNVAKGKVIPTVGIFDTHDTTLLLGGELSLADESMGLSLTAHPHDFSPMSLRAPLKIEGTFAQPRVRLDTRPLAKRLGAAVALGVISPLASLLALVDFGKEEKDVCSSAIDQLTPPNKAASLPTQGAVPVRP